MPPYGLRQTVKRKRKEDEEETNSSVLTNTQVLLKSKNKGKVTGDVQINTITVVTPLVNETKKSRGNNYLPVVKVSPLLKTQLPKDNIIPVKTDQNAHFKGLKTNSTKQKLVTKSKGQLTCNDLENKSCGISNINTSTNVGEECEVSSSSQTKLVDVQNRSLSEIMSQIITRRHSRSSSASTISLSSQTVVEEIKDDSEDCVEVYNKYSPRKYSLRKKMQPRIIEINYDSKKALSKKIPKRPILVVDLDKNIAINKQKNKYKPNITPHIQNEGKPSRGSRVSKILAKVELDKNTVDQSSSKSYVIQKKVSVINVDPLFIQVLAEEEDPLETPSQPLNVLESNSKFISPRKEQTGRRYKSKRLSSYPGNGISEDGNTMRKSGQRFPSTLNMSTEIKNRRRLLNKRRSTGSTESCSVKVITKADIHTSAVITDIPSPKTDSVISSFLPTKDEVMENNSKKNCLEEDESQELLHSSSDCVNHKNSDSDNINASELAQHSDGCVSKENSDSEETKTSTELGKQSQDCINGEISGSAKIDTLEQSVEKLGHSVVLVCRENVDPEEGTVPDCNSREILDTTEIITSDSHNKEINKMCTDEENADVETLSISSKTESFIGDLGPDSNPESCDNAAVKDFNNESVALIVEDCEQTPLQHEILNSNMNNKPSLEEDQPAYDDAAVDGGVTLVVKSLVDKVEISSSFGSSDDSAIISSFPDDQSTITFNNSSTTPTGKEMVDILPVCATKCPNLLQYVDRLLSGDGLLQGPIDLNKEETTTHKEDNFFNNIQINVNTDKNNALIVPSLWSSINISNANEPILQKSSFSPENMTHKKMNLLEIINSLPDGSVLVEKHISKNGQSFKCTKCCDVFTELKDCCNHFGECTANFRPEKVVLSGNIQWVCMLCYSNFVNNECLLEHRKSCFVPNFSDKPETIIRGKDLEASFPLNYAISVEDASSNNGNVSVLVAGEQMILEETSTTTEMNTAENNSLQLTCPACKKNFLCSYDLYVQHLHEHLEDISQRTSTESLSRVEFVADCSEGPQILSVFSVTENSANASTTEKPGTEMLSHQAVDSKTELIRAKHNKNHVPNRGKLLDSKRKLSHVHSPSVKSNPLKSIRQKNSRFIKRKKSVTITNNNCQRPIRHSFPVSSFSQNQNTESQFNSGFCESCGQVLQFPRPGSGCNTRPTFIDGKMCFSSKLMCKGCYSKHQINFCVPTNSITTTYQYHLSNFLNIQHRMSQKSIKQLYSYATRHGFDGESLINRSYSHVIMNPNSTDSQGTLIEPITSNLSIQEPVDYPSKVSSHFADPYTFQESTCDHSETLSSNILSTTSSCQYSPASASQSPHSALPEEIDVHIAYTLDRRSDHFASNEITFIDDFCIPYDVYCKSNGSYLCATCLEALPEKDIAHHFITQHNRSPMKNTYNLCLINS